MKLPFILWVWLGLSLALCGVSLLKVVQLHHEVQEVNHRLRLMEIAKVYEH